MLLFCNDNHQSQRQTGENGEKKLYVESQDFI